MLTGEAAYGDRFQQLTGAYLQNVICCGQEYASGVPPDLCAATSSRVNGSGARESLFPEPRSRPSDGQWQDIAFSMIEGDFVVAPDHRIFDTAFLPPSPYLPVTKGLLFADV